jgi:preprotein translocase subunit YajC
MTEELIINTISTVGFPIVAFLLMYRSQETTIKANTEAMNNLRLIIEKLYKE